MWREYTRETPARRGLGLVVAGFALVIAIALAWLVTSVRTSSPGTRHQQSPADWPIGFRLPEEYYWSANPSARLVGTFKDGNCGFAAYMGRSTTLGESVLIAWFAVLPEGTTETGAAERLLGIDLIEPRPIAMGPVRGRMGYDRMGDDTPAVVAVGCRDDGLAVAVKFSGPTSGRQMERILESICGSVSFRD